MRSDPIKHKAREAVGRINLTTGTHAFEMQYFQWKRNYALDIRYTTPSGKVESLNMDMLSYNRKLHSYAK